jgi:hypothetical protein
MTAVLVVGIIMALTRKPGHSNKQEVDVNNHPAKEAGKEMTQHISGITLKSLSSQEFEESIPRRFDGHRDGIVKLYNWFYSFAQSRFEGIANNMTPREFEATIFGLIPSDGASALEYFVTCFEIANYSNIKLTKENYDKCLKGVQVLKDLIDSESSYRSDHVPEHDEHSSISVTYKSQAHTES